MTKKFQRGEIRSQASSDKRIKIYQRVTGNEGPSPLMKQYLRSRKKDDSGKPTKGNPHGA